MKEDLYVSVFDNSLPFISEEYTHIYNKRINAFQQNLDDIFDRIKIRKPSLIIIDGGSGEGKTTIGVEIIDYFNKKVNLSPINFRSSQYAKGGKDFTKKLSLAHKEGYPAIIYDEAGDLNRKTTLSKFNRDLDMVFNQVRAYDMVVVLITQSVGYLENDLFTKGIVRMLINCYGRKDLIKSNFRAYELDRINYLRRSIKEEVTPTKAYQKITANNYGQFFNLSLKRDNELHKVGFEKKDQDIQKADINLDGLIDYDTLARKSGYSLQTVKIKICHLKIKPIKIFQRKAYFNYSVLDRLK